VVLAAVVIVLSALGVFSGWGNPSGWEQVVSREGRFRVRMPGQPRKEVRTVSSQAGPVTDTQFLLETKECSLGVRYADFDGPEQQAITLEEIIRAGRNATLKQYNALFLRESDINFQGYPGKEVVAEMPKRGTAYLRWYAVNRRIYALVYMNNRPTSSTTEVNRFFDSFQIIE
jgi:hypothetical protein